MPFSSFRIHAVVALAAGCVAIGVTGCASGRGARRGPPPGQEQAAAAIPEMEANGTFFAGQIDVTVLLNRAGFGPAGKDGAPGRGGPSGRGGGGGFHGGFGGPGGGPGGMPGRPEGGDEPAPRISESSLPPVQLHLRLTNHTDAIIEVQVAQFDSELGNFAVKPSKIPVPANGSADADSMTSRLGVTASVIPLTVELRAGGKRETQALSLHVKTPAGETTGTVGPAQK